MKGMFLACTIATMVRAPRVRTAARTASRDAHARLQALGSPATASLLSANRVLVTCLVMQRRRCVSQQHMGGAP